MKTIKLSIAALVLFAQAIIAQDTLCLKNKDRIAVKVIEVNPQEIKYFNSENLNGPMYVLNTSDINYIKYRNGKTDTLKSVTAVTQTKIEKYTYSSPVNNELNLSGDKIYQHGNYMSDASLFKLFKECKNPEKKAKLLSGLKEAKRYNTQQHLAPIGLGVGFLTVLATSPLVTQGDNENRFNLNWSEQTVSIAVAGIICGASLRISSCVVAKVFKNKRKQKLYELSELYNSTL